MPIKKNLLIPLFIAFIFIFTIVLYNQNQVKEIDKFTNTEFGEWASVLATGTCDPSKHNIKGWAYANPIGPISLSCTNETAPVNYGVNIHENVSQNATCSGTINCDEYIPAYASSNYSYIKITGVGNGGGSGTITIPDNVYSVDLTVVGGGAAGGASYGASFGGAGGYVKNQLGYPVSPGDVINITVGAGGVYNGTDTISKKGKGSVFGSINSGDTVEKASYSGGGSGGGYGYLLSSMNVNGGRGGSDGGDGLPGGPGQGSTTKGIIDQVLYAGGGGGGTAAAGRNGGDGGQIGGPFAFGKAGGGGSPSAYNGEDGSPHTGSGGGGAANHNGIWGVPGKGGSGVIIVRYLKPQIKDLSGYAWSPAIGPISFNESEICANGNCIGAFPSGASRTTSYGAKVEYVSDGVAKITGWARALGACDFDFAAGHCTTNGAGSDAGGWDGWIKFDKDSTINYSKGNIVSWRSNCEHFLCTMGQQTCEIMLESYCNSGNAQHCSDEFSGFNEICAFPVYEHGGDGVGTEYNTYIKSVLGMNGHKRYFVEGTAWGGDILDGRTPPSSVLGEIVFLNAETTYNPNSACAGAKPVASFKLGCLNDEVSSSNTCYFNVGSPITLLNESSDLDEGSPCYIPNDIKTSTWSPVGGTVSGRDNSSFIPTDTASYTQNISLTVEDYQGLTSDPFNGSWTLKRAIQANFSCCIKNVDGGSDCSENGHFKNCGSGFTHLTVTEDTKLYLRDNISLTTQHTIPASGLSVASRSWTYPQGAVSGSGENINIPIKQGGIITLTATDASGDDTEPKELDIMFKKINKNPDFKEIPFD